MFSLDQGLELFQQWFFSFPSRLADLDFSVCSIRAVATHTDSCYSH